MLDDPTSLILLGLKEAQWLRDNPAGFRYMRSAVVVLSGLADDVWIEAVERGIDQYVILGPGLDASVYRQPDVAGLIVVVDLPAMQQWKQVGLHEAGVPLPSSMRSVSIDFERVGLAEGLAYVGFKPGTQAIFSWLGVSMYVDKVAVEETLRGIASCAKGGAMLVQCAMPLHGLPPMMRMAIEQLTAQFAEHGEPWKSFFEPVGLAEMLTALGFSSDHVWTPDELNQRYPANRPDGLHIGAAPTRLVLVTVCLEATPHIEFH